jgi:uncharacterized delta-60 repeat protein
MIENINLTLDLTNNVNYPVTANVLGSNIDLLDTSNNNIEYRWDVTGFVFAGENAITLQYKLNNDPYFSTYTQIVLSPSFDALITALNGLGIGFFSYYTESGNDYIGTYNNAYTFGDLNLYVSSVVNQNYQSGVGFNNQTNQTLPLGNGGVIYVGAFTSFQATTTNYFATINPDGSLDTNYNIGTGFNADINAIEQQSNGSYVVGGQFTDFDGTTTSNLVSLYATPQVNGTSIYNSNFAYGTGFSGGLTNCIAVQSDGKIIVGGIFTSYDGNPCSQNIIRLNQDGSVDNTFNAGTGFNGNVNFLILQSDGKIVVGGSFTQFDVNVVLYICRLNADGSYDSSFNIGSSFNFGSVVQVLQIQGDGKVLVGGSFNTYQGNASKNIVRINSDGSYDSTLSVGSGFDFNTTSIQIQGDGKILVGGSFTNYNGNARNYIIRLNSNGTIDTSFVIGTGFNNNTKYITLQSSGKIIVAGQFTTYNTTNSCSKIARLNSNGSFDTTFNIGIGFATAIQQTNYLAIQSDDKIIVSGTFTGYQSTPANRIIRLNSDGTIDTTWDYGSGFNTASGFIALDLLNSIIYIGGLFTSFDGVSANGIISLYVNAQDTYGFLNTTFNNYVLSYLPNTSIIYDIIQLQNTQILVAGNFTTIGGDYIYIMRINPDGSLDNTFSPSLNCNAIIVTLGTQQDGSILAGGNFTSYQGQTCNHIFRLQQNGLFDTTFNIGTAFNNDVSTLTVLSNNQVLVGGQFTSFNGNSCTRIARLNSDGSFDNTFNSGTGFNSYPSSIVEMGDGTYLIGGDFTSYNGTTHNYIVRLNNDGSVFYDWNEGTGFDASVINISPTNVNGSVYVSGTFTSFNGTPANRTILLSV